MSGKLELIIDSKSRLGESPCWDEINQNLLWIDGYAGKVNLYNSKDRNNYVIMDTNQYIGCINLRKKGGAVLALQDGVYFFDIERKKMTNKIADPEPDKEYNRLNDGKCDCYGRFWFGSMNMEGHHKNKSIEPTGALYCMDVNLKIRQVENNVAISNGLTWSLDNKKMYYIDSPTREVVVYDYNAYIGKINNRRKIIKFPEEQGIPDGMTIDEEGKLWIAHFGGYQVSRWNPENGKKIDKIKLPVKNVTSCAFGGKDYDELYITTARAGLSKQEIAEQPQAGGLFSIRPGVNGLPPNRFKG